MGIEQKKYEYNDYHQISLLANNVLNWYNAFFIQTGRLIETNEQRRKETTNKNELMPDQVEAFFWTAALRHAVNGVRKLRKILDRHNDPRIDKLCDLLAEKSFVEKVDICRNANEHFDEYLCGQGHNMKGFGCVLSIDDDKLIGSNQHWIVVYENKWFIGGLDVAKTVEHMKKYKEEVNTLLELITDEYWTKGTN